MSFKSLSASQMHCYWMEINPISIWIRSSHHLFCKCENLTSSSVSIESQLAYGVRMCSLTTSVYSFKEESPSALLHTKHFPFKSAQPIAWKVQMNEWHVDGQWICVIIFRPPSPRHWSPGATGGLRWRYRGNAPDLVSHNQIWALSQNWPDNWPLTNSNSDLI